MSIISCFPGGAPAKIPIIAVASAAALPTAAKEGTIALITSTALGTAYIGNMTVAAPAAGDVQIFTATTAVYPLAPLRNQDLQVYPASARQYDGSAWGTVAMYQRAGGAWVQQIAWLLNGGNQYTALTGGWAQGSTNTGYGSYASVTNSGLTVHGNYNTSSPGYASMVTVNPIDVTGIRKLTLQYTFANPQGTSYPARHLALRASFGASDNVAVASNSSAGNHNDLVLDVSSFTGNYHVAVCAGNGCTLYATQVYGE